MDELTKAVLGIAVPQLGVASIFVWMYWKERENRISETDKKDALSKSVTEVFVKNIEVMTEVKSTIRENADRVAENTTATTNLVNTIDLLLKHGYNKNS